MTNVLNPWAEMARLKRENQELQTANIHLQVNCAVTLKRYEALRREVDTMKQSIENLIVEQVQIEAVRQILNGDNQT